MASETIPTDPSQVISLDMEAEEASVKPVETTSQPTYTSQQAPTKSLSWARSVAPKDLSLPESLLDEKIIVWDCETTGVEPWDYRWNTVSFWDISLPVSQMVTFADWDEEQLTKEAAEWLQAEEPDAMSGFNTAYDIRCMTSRMMFYRVPCPAICKCKHYDTRDLMKKGVRTNVFSDQPSGSLEDWGIYFFNEHKPFTIDEIFAGMDKGDLGPSIKRNRWDVYMEGQLFMLFYYVSTGGLPAGFVSKPTISARDEMEAVGVVSTPCPTCRSINEFPLDRETIDCYVCFSTIPRPAGLGILKEITRPVVTPGEAKAAAAAAKKSTVKKK